MPCRMASSVLRGLIFICLVLSAYCILIGRLRQREEPASNIVPSSEFLFPEGEPDDCKTDLGYPGICVDVRKCYAARQAVRARNHPVRCGWINHYIPRVCCHPDQVQRVKMVFRPYRNRNRYRTDW